MLFPYPGVQDIQLEGMDLPCRRRGISIVTDATWTSAITTHVSPLISLERLLRRTDNGQSGWIQPSQIMPFSPSPGPSATRNGHNKRTPADAGVLEYRYLMESFLSGRSLANCRKFTAIT